MQNPIKLFIKQKRWTQRRLIELTQRILRKILSGINFEAFYISCHHNTIPSIFSLPSDVGLRNRLFTLVPLDIFTSISSSLLTKPQLSYLILILHIHLSHTEDYPAVLQDTLLNIKHSHHVILLYLRHQLNTSNLFFFLYEEIYKSDGDFNCDVCVIHEGLTLEQ